MTHMLAEYRRHREQGHSHTGALKAISRRFDFDIATAGRIIDRAEHEDKTNRRPEAA